MNFAGAARFLIRYGAFLALAGSFLFAQSRDFDAAFQPVLAAHHFAEVSISPDGKHVVWIESKVKNDTEFAHTVFLKETNSSSAAREIGRGDPRSILGISSVAWSPDSKSFAYIEETSSREGSALKIVDAGSGTPRTVGTWPAAINSPLWSPDGRSISVLYSEEDQPAQKNSLVTLVGETFTHQRLALIDVASGVVHMLTPADVFVYQYDWSPDGRRMVMTAEPCCDEKKGTGENNWWTAELYRLDVSSGQSVSIFKSQWQIASPKWSPDGKQIAFIGGLMSDFIAPGGDLFVIPAAGGAPRNATPNVKASITWITWTGADQVLTTQIADGQGAIALVHPSTSAAEMLWQSPEGPYNGGLMFAMSVAHDGVTSAAARESFAHAPEVWAGPVGKWQQISSVNTAKSEFGKAESVHWMSDGAQVQGWLIYPKNFTAGKKYPMVVSVHGGPAASALQHWPAAFDNMATLSSFDYFVFYPNPRGSFGQGESFTQGNVKDLGSGDLRDIEAGVRYVTQNFPVDANRVGITGWSYGGYMAMWAITQTDMFHASVAGPGVSDWQSYYGQTEIAKWLLPYFGASAYDAPLLYAKNSPSRFVKNVHTPTLFYVGNEDPVCPVPQTFQLWNALRDQGVETQLLLYSKEAHGVHLPADQIDVTRRTLQWFGDHLK